MIEGGAGYANASRLGQPLQARGDVDPVSVDIVSVNNDVAEIYANAKPNSLCFRGALIVASHSPLDRGRTLDGVDDACELNQRAVTHELDDAAMELFYSRINQFPTAGLQPRQRADLILPHEAAVANHIGGQDCGKPSLHPRILRPSSRIVLPFLERMFRPPCETVDAVDAEFPGARPHVNGRHGASVALYGRRTHLIR